MTPFTLKIFVADGDPDGLRLVVLSSRALLPKVKAGSKLLETKEPQRG